MALEAAIPLTHAELEEAVGMWLNTRHLRCELAELRVNATENGRPVSYQAIVEIPGIEKAVSPAG